MEIKLEFSSKLYNLGKGGPVCDKTTVELREQLSEVLNQVSYGKQTVRVTRRGKPLAVIIPVEVLDAIAKSMPQIKSALEGSSSDEKSLEEIEAELEGELQKQVSHQNDLNEKVYGKVSKHTKHILFDKIKINSKNSPFPSVKL